jgi:exodeoxyribonuclease X
LIRVIDIETTGTDPANDAIIEIASVDLVRGGGITNAMDTLVRPGKPIPPRASAVHHIVDEDVANAPALAEVVDRFRGADFYVVHNCEFEASFFAAQGIELGPSICTYKWRSASGPTWRATAIRSCATRLSPWKLSLSLS